MFTLKNKHGNIVKTVETERQRDNLIDLGYTVISATTEETPLSLDEMKVEQLEAYAKEKDIDLSDCKNKAEKLAKIKEFEGKIEE